MMVMTDFIFVKRKQKNLKIFFARVLSLLSQKSITKTIECIFRNMFINLYNGVIRAHLAVGLSLLWRVLSSC